MIQLANKKIVIVGASSGIGRALASIVSAQGAIVYLVSRSKEKLQQVKDSLPGEAHVLSMDMLDDASVNSTFEAIGAFDFLTFTAVADETKLMAPIKSMSNTVAQRGMEKFWGTFNVARAAANHINQQGAMVFTSSMAIYHPSKNGASMMNAASAAVAVFSKALALEIAPVRVNVVAPGVVATGVWTDAQLQSNEQWAKDTLPVGHLGTAQELAHVYLSLLTNPYMTGSVVTADGGLALV